MPWPELQHRRHEPVASVGAWLRKVISLYYQYRAVPGNLPRQELFRWRLGWVWWRALSRRRDIGVKLPAVTHTPRPWWSSTKTALVVGSDSSGRVLSK